MVLALVAAGCGGDDDASSTAAPVDEWADDFCGAVTGWAEELRQIAEGINDPSSLSVDALKDAGQDASDATDSFVEDLRELGAPDTESGDEIGNALETLSETLETERDDLSEAVDDIDGLNDLPTAISVIGASLSSMGTALQTTLSAFGSSDADGELETAFENSDACDDLQS